MKIPPLTHTEARVLLAACAEFVDHGTSIPDLVSATRRSRHAVRKALAALRAKGLGYHAARGRWDDYPIRLTGSGTFIHDWVWKAVVYRPSAVAARERAMAAALAALPRPPEAVLVIR